MKKKRCTKCGEIKPLNEFYRDKDKKDGRKYKCKYCELEKKRKDYQKNHDKFKEKNRRNYQNNYEKFKEKYRKYYQNNLEKIKKTQRKYRQNNPRRGRYYRKYYMNNLEKHREYERKYYLKRRNRLWQLKPKTQKEVIEMWRMLLQATLKAVRERNHEVLNWLKAKYEQLANMPG